MAETPEFSDAKNARSVSKPVISKLSGVLDIVQEKLASLKEKEKQIIKMAQTRKRKPVDPSVKEELVAMASSVGNIFGGVKLNPSVRSEKPLKRKKDAPVIPQLEKPIFKPSASSGKTMEEKYRMLDARDKLLQARRDRGPGKGRKLVGTCPDMCPEKERLRRCYQNQLSPFEMIDYPQNTEMREEWMVKEYARSSADQDTPLPHDLRPVPVLQRTMEHLCRHIADRSENSDELLEDWYMFMWDRTRAIRKDLTHQDLCSPSAVILLEQCARFHIHCAERLIGQDVSVYDDKINTENLTKCLQTLKYMYNDLRSVGVVCPNIAEFMCYSLLLNLNNPSIMAEIRDMPDDVMNSEPITFALDVISARETKNYCKFFKLVKNTSYLNSCILRRYFSEVRLKAFSSLVRTRCPKQIASVPIPLLPLIESLMFENVQDCAHHLELCNLRYNLIDCIVFLSRQRFQIPGIAFTQMPSVLYIQKKKNAPLSEIIWGEELDEASPVLSLHSSFDANGELKIETVDIEDDIEVVEEEQKEEDEEEAIEEDYVEDDDVFVGEYDNDTVDDDDAFQEEPEEIAKPLFSSVVKSKSIFATSPVASKPTFGAGADPKSFFSFGNIFNKPELVSEPITAPVNIELESHQEFVVKNFEKKSESPEIENSLTIAWNQASIEAELEKKAAEERRKREEAERKIKELEELREKERVRREKEMQLEKDKQMAEMRRNEAIKKQEEKEKARLAEIELRNVKLKKLRDKYRSWKVGVFARAWRQKAWLLAEERKVSKYFRRISEEYPPVCGPELLDGNPFELIIPNALLLQPRSFREFQIPSKLRFPKSGPPPMLPLVHMGRAVGPTLYNRVKELYPDPVSKFRSCFPWKLVLCLPDEIETNVRLDTFLEMHFVDKFNWKFGIETGPLVSCTHSIGTLQLIISVRRIKGLKMLEGNVSNPDAVLGANSLLFFLTDEPKKLAVAKDRLNQIHSLPGGKEIPIVAFVFGSRLDDSIIRSALNLDASSRIVSCNGANQQSLVTTLSQSLSLAADISAKVPTVRTVRLDSLLKTPILDQIWRRADIALINYDIIMKEAQPLITYYNQCLDNFVASLTDPNLDKQAHLAIEFESILSQLEKPLQFSSRPKRDTNYCKTLTELIRKMRLPEWPAGFPKSTQELNYRLHCYGKNITNGNNTQRKYLKWRIYRIIQGTLLWKGLDIYCDDDINLILLRFPWVEVFQEFARARVETISTDLLVTYDQSKINDFCYDPPLVDLLGRYDQQLPGFDPNWTQPMPEKDGLLLAYSNAVERLAAEEEASKIYEPSFSEQVAEALEKGCDIQSPAREPSGLKRSFNELEESIAEISANLEKRRKVLQEMIGEFHEIDS